MKELALTKGLVALVDDADFHLTEGFRWCASKSKGNATYYAKSARTVKRAPVYLHRLIMQPDGKRVVDHRDGNGLDCRRSNMRVCTQAQNAANCVKKGKSSIYRGIKKCYGGWMARLKFNYREIYLGYYRSEIEAAAAYNEGAKIYFGEFARLNVLPD